MFNETDYRCVLANQIKKHGKTKGYKQRMAEAMGCHSSFLSQVLRGSSHLTPDHAASLCRFWKWEQDQTQYFINLVSLARCSSPDYRGYLQRQQQKIRQKQSQLTTRIESQRKIVPEDSLATWYYSHWINIAVHITVSLTDLKTAQAISQRLRIPEQDVSRALTSLAEEGLICRHGQEWQMITSDLHLSAPNPILNQHHSNWRQYAMTRMGISTHSDSLHYTAIMATSRKDWQVMRELAMTFLQETRNIAKTSDEEDIFCLGIDMFSI